MFPLVQLPKKFKVLSMLVILSIGFLWFPLVQLPKKFKENEELKQRVDTLSFPLVQLPKKFKAGTQSGYQLASGTVSISSTSEEV